MKSVRRILWLAPLLLALSACHALRAKSCHGAQPYMGAKSVAPLKIPAGLDPPETGNALRIPALNEPAPPARKGKDPCLDEPPPFKVRQAAAPPQA
jgi:uncharacterized lipoprotein